MGALNRRYRLKTFFYLIPVLATGFLQGCGEPEVGDPQIVTADVEPTPTPVPVPTATPQPVEVDFASLIPYPDLTYTTSRTLSPAETDRNLVLDAPEYSSEVYWRSATPATFELELPSGASVHRIEVEGAEGSAGFPECVVFVRSATETNWRRPAGLVLEQQLGKFVEGKGYRLRHIFSFDETPASRTLIGIARGSNETPDSASVVDIDVFGYVKD